MFHFEHDDLHISHVDDDSSDDRTEEASIQKTLSDSFAAVTVSEASLTAFGTPTELKIPIQNFSFSALPESKNVESGPKPSKSDFDLLSVIGRGAYGKVFLVKKISGNDCGTYYAMKVLQKAHLVLQNATQSMRERNILQELRHPFIVELFYAFQTNDKLYLILGYAAGGELFTYLQKEKMFSEDFAQFYLAQLLLALSHLHSLSIIYRDLKPENVLLDMNGNVKLTDFGLSKEKSQTDDASQKNTVCGTVEYMAPEVLSEVAYTFAVDWWSFGCLAFDMMTGNPPFVASNRKKVVEAILNKKPKFPNYLSQDARDLLTKLLRKHPASRLSDSSLIQKHRFFDGIDFKKLIKGEYEPPIKPHIAHPEDVSNFDIEMRRMPLLDSSTEGVGESGWANQNQDLFQGFSYVSSYFTSRNSVS